MQQILFVLSINQIMHYVILFVLTFLLKEKKSLVKQISNIQFHNYVLNKTVTFIELFSNLSSAFALIEVPLNMESECRFLLSIGFLFNAFLSTFFTAFSVDGFTIRSTP
jgi:hypothetical protein